MFIHLSSKYEQKNDLNQQTNNGNGYDDAQSVLIVYTLFFENTASFGIDQRIFF